MVLLVSAAKDSAAGPSVLSQYGPLIAALIALSGAMVTLFVSMKRDDTRYREQRGRWPSSGQKQIAVLDLRPQIGFGQTCADRMPLR